MRIFFRILLFIFVFLVLVVTFVLMYFTFAERVGSAPKGARLERIEGSPHYMDGEFQNPIETDMDIPWRVLGAVIWEGIVGGEGRVPAAPIPTVPFDREAWDLVPDTAFAVAWFGHSTVLVKIDGITLLCDPVFSERGSAFSFIGPKRFPYTNHMTLEELPHVDAVLLSHDHYDHLDHGSVLFLKNKVERWFMPLGVGAHLEYWGVPATHIHEFDLWEGDTIGNTALTLVPTRHFSGRGLRDRFSTLWGGWAMNGRNANILFGGDSGSSPTFGQIGERLGPFDLVMLECGAYNEHWSSIHMFPEEVPVMAADLRARSYMPIHWAKFDLALHPWKEPIERLTAVAGDGPSRLITPRIGGITINARPTSSERWWTHLE